VPQLMPDSTRVPVLPKGDWRAFDLTREQHPDLPTLKLRPGAILPVGPEQQFTDQKPLDPLTLIVNLDEKGIAFGELYEDAGDGFGYKDGDYLLTTYGAERTAQGVRVMVARTEGRRARPDRELIVRVLTPTGVIEQRGRDGKDVIVPISR
jgi:alpha-glucosidase